MRKAHGQHSPAGVSAARVSSPRRLSLFIRSLAGGGGAERMMVHLARGLVDQGHEVDLVLGRAEGHFLDLVPDAVRVVDLEVPGLRSGVPSILADASTARMLAPILLTPGAPWILGAIPALRRHLESRRPDAIISGLNYTNITAVLARRALSFPIRQLLIEQNTISVRAANSSKPWWRRLPRLVRDFYPDADAVAGVSRGVSDDLREILPAGSVRIETVYNPVVAPGLERDLEAPVDHPFFEEGEQPVLLAVGKLKHQKDYPNLLHAFAALRRRRPARLIILGEGPLRRRLEGLARDLGIEADVSMPGFVENPFVYMSRASVFVLSSAWEGLPTVLVEALACGCNVVSTECPSGPAEILDGGAFGRLVPVRDSAALATAIESALDSPSEPARSRERAGFFTIERAARDYLEILFPAAEAEAWEQPGPGLARPVAPTQG